MPQTHRKQAPRPISAAAASTKEAETSKRRGPLTLPEIREIRMKAPRVGDGGMKQLAEAFTLEDVDAEERAYLTIFRAVYRRCEDIYCDDNAPLEKFIKSLLFHVSFWPMTHDDVKSEFEQSEPDWCQREEASRVVQEVFFVIRRLRKARGRDLLPQSCPDDQADYVLNEYDAKGNLAKAVPMSRDQYLDVKKTLLEQGCEIVDEAAAQTAAAGKG